MLGCFKNSETGKILLLLSANNHPHLLFAAASDEVDDHPEAAAPKTNGAPEPAPGAHTELFIDYRI